MTGLRSNSSNQTASLSDNFTLKNTMYDDTFALEDESTILIYDIMSLFFFFIGFTGNILTTVTLRKRENRSNVTSVFIVVLAISDNIILVVGTLHPALYAFVLDELFSDLECEITVYFHIVSLQVSSWVLAVISIERLLCVSLPHKSKLIFTPRKAIIISIFLVVASSCMNIPLLIRELDGPCSCFIREDSTSTYTVMPILDFLFTFFLPFVIILVSSIIIVVMLRIRVIGNQASKVMFSVSVTMLIVNLVFIVTMLPFCVMQIIYICPADEIYIIWQGLYRLAQLNPVFNFFIYCLGNPRFRNDVKNMFCCGSPQGAT